MIKMIVVDLDGTLLDDEKKYDLDTVNLLSQLKAKGYLIVIATGRALASALRVTNGAFFASYLIASAGSVLYDVSESKVIQKKVLPKECASLLARFVPNYFKYLAFLRLNELVIYGEKPSLNSFERYITSSDLITLEDITLINLYVQDLNKLNLLYNVFKEKLPMLDVKIMQNSQNNYQWLYMIHKGQNKFVYIHKLLEQYHLKPEEVLAFGDGFNDLEVFKEITESVAMANASFLVKRHAKYVTLSNNDRGIYAFLKNYLDLKETV